MKQSFIKSMENGAREGYAEYGILPSLIMAQGILESGWGKSELAKASNNLFGIKADSSWKGDRVYSPTKEFVNGKWIDTKACFRSYKTVGDSILDHAKFLNKERYDKVRKCVEYTQACVAIHEAGYATDPNYSSKLANIIKENKLYEYDVIEEIKVHWAEKDYQELLANGINISDRRFEDNMKRGEVISLLNRVVKELIKNENK